MPDTIPGEVELDRFKSFVYRTYHETHPNYGDDIDKISEGRYCTLKRFFGEALPSDRAAAILDYGCGDGQVLSVLQDLGYAHLFGVDLSPALLAVAARRTRAELRHGDGLDFLATTPDETFDVIIAFDVLEHLTRPRLLETCREAVRTLKPHGRLLLCVPNGASPFCGLVLWDDVTHERAYTLSSIAQVLAPLGFEDIEAKEVAPVPHGWKSALRAFLWRLIRAGMIFIIAVERGSVGNAILTPNMFLTARKAA